MSKRSGIMLCYPFEEKRLLAWEPPYIVQPKLDGERCRAVLGDDLKWTLLSSEQNEFISVPHINKALSSYVDKFHKGTELDGELYIHGSSFEEIHSIVSRTANLHPNYEKMQYHIFDIVKDDVQAARTIQLQAMFDFCHWEHPLIRVPDLLAHTLEDVLEIYNHYVSEGYEGMVVRHPGALYIRRRSTYMMKFKPKKSDFYKIIGFKQMIDKNGNPKRMLGALICTSDEGTEFSVGSGMTDEFRDNYWPHENAQSLIGKICHVQYQHTTPGKGVPRFPVFVEVIDPTKELPCPLSGEMVEWVRYHYDNKGGDS